MRIKKIVWKDFTQNPIFTKDEMWVQGDLNTNILELEVDSNFIGKEVQLITGKAGSIDAVVYRQVISELNTFVIENTAVKSGNFNIFLRVLDGDNLLVSEAIKYEVKQGVCFSRISIPKKDEDWIEHVLADLKKTTEKAVIVNSELENTIADSVEKDELLKTTVEKAETTDEKLETTIIDSIEKNLELENTVTDSVVKKEELENTIADSVEKKSELDSTVTSAIEENSDLNKTITDSVIKKEALETTIVDSVNKKLLLDGSIQTADEKVVELELVAKDKLEDINETSDSRLVEINKVADDRIEEVKVSGGAVNKLNNQTFEFWLGTTADYEAIVEKSRGVLYQHFDADGNFVGGYYKKKIPIPDRGLVRWFDYSDGKEEENSLKCRVSDTDLTLNNFDFNENSGWTGKGLKFDGVDDWGEITFDNASDFLKGDFTIETTFLTHNIANKSRISLSTFGTMLACSKEGQINCINKTDYKFVSNYEEEKTTNTFTKENDVILFYQNGVLKGRVPLVDWDLNIDANLEKKILIGRLSMSVARISGVLKFSDKFYNVALTPEEIQQNYEYEQSIDRTTISTYPLLQEQKSYGIGLTNQLSEEQKSKFRLSIDRTKFVVGLRYCEGLEVEEFTYSEIQVEMEKEEWRGEVDE